MVINYKRLNDNTIDDGYNIPNKQEWINMIQGCKYFSKFDLKARFWQVKMTEEGFHMSLRSFWMATNTVRIKKYPCLISKENAKYL
jgi:hypothetical protein